MEEIWKDIEGYEGIYQVSNNGRVRSLLYNKIKMLKTQTYKRGYKYIALSKNGEKKKYKIHRLVAQAFIPNPNNYPQINHKDEDKSNNYINNLEWCTPKYNNNFGTRNERAGQSLKGRNIKEETRRKISEANKGRKSSFIGKQHTEESKMKMRGKRECIMGEKHPHSRKVRCVNTGEEFKCMKEAYEKYNIASGDISRCCNGKRKTAGKHPITGERLKWEYVKEVI